MEKEIFYVENIKMVVKVQIFVRNQLNIKGKKCQ